MSVEKDYGLFHTNPNHTGRFIRLWYTVSGLFIMLAPFAIIFLVGLKGCL